jgi:prepilin peptidase CpaA
MPWIFLSSTVTVVSALAAGLLTFLITVPLYFFGVLGAGDSKLLSALALFFGLGQLLNFLVFTALAGGILAICSFALHPTRTLVMLQMRGKGTFGRGLPYGVAIAVGAAGALLAPSRHAFWS